ncbi:hypothetical protein GYMLUDRAFT_239592 [Collybiopsis luxurians FD-317 M1]|nr:hypothetical protein GYMLUDRAFT_239592 [Collybiopsis luxurians FD-317 M1]
MPTTSFLLRFTSAALLLLSFAGAFTLSYAVPVSPLAEQNLPSSHSLQAPGSSKPTISSGSPNATSSNQPTGSLFLPERRLERRVGNGLIDDIKTWAEKNIIKIQTAQALKGGWEGWAQVELALYLNSQPHQKADREGAYEGSGQRWDLRTQPTKTGDTARTTNFIELKCQRSSETIASLVTRVQKDVNKMTDGQFEVHSYVAWVIAFASPGEESVAGLEQLEFGGSHFTKQVISNLGGAGTSGIAFWWGSQRVRS